MVDSIKAAISAMCKAHPAGRLGMAADLGMSIDTFHNHLYEKCGSRFFTLKELERMEDLSGVSMFAEYAAARVGKLLVDVLQPENIDNVDLYALDMQANAAKGQLAQAQIEAAADGVIDRHESKKLMNLLKKTVRHQIQGVMGFMALYSVSDQAVEVFMSTRKGDAPSVQLEASGASFQ
ncbi:YmfL family putative regulatory protein [Franconibacter pulveris]